MKNTNNSKYNVASKGLRQNYKDKRDSIFKPVPKDMPNKMLDVEYLIRKLVKKYYENREENTRIYGSNHREETNAKQKIISTITITALGYQYFYKMNKGEIQNA